MNNETFYKFQTEFKDTIEAAQDSLDRIKATQSHLYPGECAGAIADLLEAVQQLQDIHSQRCK